MNGIFGWKELNINNFSKLQSFNEHKGASCKDEKSLEKNKHRQERLSFVFAKQQQTHLSNFLKRCSLRDRPLVQVPVLINLTFVTWL